MKTVKVLVVGLPVIILNQVFILVLSLLFGDSNPADPSHMLTLGFALAALPMLGLTLALTMLLRINSGAEACYSGGIWTVQLIGYFILVGIGNNNIQAVFLTPTLYLMFLGTFAGPVIYTRLQR